MPKLTITQAHALPLDQVKARLEGLANRLAAKYGIEAKWTSERQASISRTGVSGVIQIADDKVTVNLDLSFLLSPLKDKVESRVGQELRNALAADPPA
jgi:putative polyhydroxyalkanoate system protein